MGRRIGGKCGCWGRLGAQDLLENAPDRSCQELRPCHCPPKEGEPRATNLDGGNGGKTYKVEETGMRL